MVKNSRAATIIPNLVLLGRLSIRKILHRYTDTMAGNIGPSRTIVDLNLGYICTEHLHCHNPCSVSVQLSFVKLRSSNYCLVS
jgi:hypothetical protein